MAAPTTKKSSRWQPGKSGNPATQFKAGKSGNPDGQPYKFESIDYWLKQKLGETIEDGPYKGKLKADAIADIATNNALAGEREDIKFVSERVDGKPTQKVEADGNVEYVFRLEEYRSRKKEE